MARGQRGVLQRTRSHTVTHGLAPHPPPPPESPTSVTCWRVLKTGLTVLGDRTRGSRTRTVTQRHMAGHGHVSVPPGHEPRRLALLTPTVPHRVSQPGVHVCSRSGPHGLPSPGTCSHSLARTSLVGQEGTGVPRRGDAGVQGVTSVPTRGTVLSGFQRRPLPMLSGWTVAPRIQMTGGRAPQRGGHVFGYKWGAQTWKATRTPLANCPCRAG